MLVNLSTQKSETLQIIDMLWLLVCASLVFLMQPGFMCLESGLTRSKNNINVAIKNLSDFGISVLLFWIIGYGLMFGNSIAGWIGIDHFFLDAAEQPELIAFFVFQAMFCGTATTIVSGAVAERLKFGAYILIAILVSALIYPLFGSWVWNGFNLGEIRGWLGQRGFIDFAGATVVHSIGAWVSLAILVIIGPRTGRFPEQGPPRKIQGSNLPMAVLGAMLLWFGWIGFNGGSTLDFNNQVAGIIMNTLVAGAAGMLMAALLTWLQHGLVEVEAVINGSIAGLVAITAACHAVTTPIALIIGGTGAAIMLLMARLLERWHVDDAVDAVAVHAGAGAWGTIAVGLFGQLDHLGTGLSRGAQIWVQCEGVLVAFIWAFGITWLILQGINRIQPLRVSIEEEELGLNIAEHRAKTELYDLFRVMDTQARTQDLSLRVPADPFTEVGHIALRYNQVMDALERKTAELLQYLGQVNLVTAAASAVEADTFQPSSLNSVAARSDELGTLAQVFQRMFQQVKSREKKLQQAKEELAQMNEMLEERVQIRTQELAQANAQILKLNEQLQEENLRMSAELDITRKLQQMFLPTEEELQKMSGLDISGFMEPATEVGGDYYDVLQQGDRIKIGIGDVTGHGLESGVLMIMAHTAVRTLLANQETDPTKFLNALNQMVFENVQRMKSYKNMTLAILDYEAGVLRMSGQHEALIVVRSNGEVEEVDTFDLGFPLGLEPDISHFVSETKVELKAGDLAVLYTDGITEAMNDHKQQYGLVRLCQCLQNHRHLSSREIRQAVIDDVRQFIGHQSLYDDLTLLVMKQK